MNHTRDNHDPWTCPECRRLELETEGRIEEEARVKAVAARVAWAVQANVDYSASDYRRDHNATMDLMREADRLHGRLPLPDKQEVDEMFMRLAGRIARHARREARRARVVRWSKVVGSAVLGVSIAVAFMLLVTWLADTGCC